MSIRDCAPGCEEHYACRMRAKGLHVSPGALPTRRNQIPPKPSTPPSHWRKQAVDVRPDGSGMPIFNSDGTPVRMKQVYEQGHKIDKLKRMQQLPSIPPVA